MRSAVATALCAVMEIAFQTELMSHRDVTTFYPIRDIRVIRDFPNSSV